jgi:HAD superfamily hydrolase (TIGR01490 family)
VAAAAFFDLDRTLIRRSSVLTLAPAFRRAGLIRRRDLVHSALLQAQFVLRGASAERVRTASEDGLRVLAGYPVSDLRSLVAGQMERALQPLVYGDALKLAAEHRERGERTYIASATLQEIVEAFAQLLSFDGAIGSLCEIVDGVYTGRPLRAAHGESKAEAVRALAAEHGFDLAASSAYSDSYTDVPFLEAVGRPVAVNPDRRLRAIAAARGWPVLRFAA